MNLAFYILALITLGAAVAAMSMRNLVHGALCLVAAFAGLAGLYLNLRAEFVGFVQVLVYVGAVAILVVFAILLTHAGEAGDRGARRLGLGGIGVAVLVAGVLIASVVTSQRLAGREGEAPSAPVTQIGRELMSTYVVPLEAIGLVLTAALIGAVLIARQDQRRR